MTTYTHQTIDPPGSTYTIANSINSNGRIVGLYYDSNHVEHGFLDNNGVYTTIDPPGSVYTDALTSIRWDKSSGSTTPLASAD